jgi:hypothetical protein
MIPNVTHIFPVLYNAIGDGVSNFQLLSLLRSCSSHNYVLSNKPNHTLLSHTLPCKYKKENTAYGSLVFVIPPKLFSLKKSDQLLFTANASKSKNPLSLDRVAEVSRAHPQLLVSKILLVPQHRPTHQTWKHSSRKIVARKSTLDKLHIKHAFW